jgi:hypothetical protein
MFTLTHLLIWTTTLLPAKLLVSLLRKLRMMMGHNSPTLGVFSNLKKMPDGHCVRGRQNLKDIRETKKKEVSIHGHPLKMRKCLNV